MGFDVTRAVSEAIGSRTPLLDRILSFLYFADLTVVEQSTWDDHGSGISLIAFKGPASGAKGVTLVGPLPGCATLGAPGRWSWNEAADLARFVDLMARIHALSEFDAGMIRSPLVLLGYRPDPVASSLRALLDSGEGTGKTALVYGPVGPSSGDVRWGAAVGMANLPMPRAKGASRRLRDVVRVSASRPRDEVRPLWLGEVLSELKRLVLSGSVVLLDLHPAIGADLDAPGIVEMELGLTGPTPVWPDGWEMAEYEGNYVRLGAWAGVLDAVLELNDRLSDEVLALWKESRCGTPASQPVYPVLLEREGDCVRLGVVAILPAGGPQPLQAIAERLSGVASAGLEGKNAVFHLTGIGRGEGGRPGRKPVAWAPGPAPFLAGIVPRCRVLGPTPSEAWEDPAGTAGRYAALYRDLIETALRSR